VVTAEVEVEVDADISAEDAGLEPQWITPVALAKEMGIRPQRIYGLVKQNKISVNKPEDGSAWQVDPEEVANYVASAPGRGRPKGSKNSDSPSAGPRRSFQVGDYVEWSDERRGGTHYGQVIEIDPGEDGEPEGSLTRVRMFDGSEDAWFATDSLQLRIGKGQVHIAKPRELISTLIEHYEARGMGEISSCLHGALSGLTLQKGA
jgi:hypothetical protein